MVGEYHLFAGVSLPFSLGFHELPPVAGPVDLVVGSDVVFAMRFVEHGDRVHVYIVNVAIYIYILYIIYIYIYIYIQICMPTMYSVYSVQMYIYIYIIFDCIIYTHRCRYTHVEGSNLFKGFWACPSQVQQDPI